jgi:hypothetical protein
MSESEHSDREFIIEDPETNPDSQFEQSAELSSESFPESDTENDE